MGTTQSILSKEQIEEYIQLTYLTKSEIFYILDKFSNLDGNSIKHNIEYRFAKSQIFLIWPELRFNPFCDRIFKIFSSYNDNKLSFEDALNLCSVFSTQCPLEVKAAWAFKLFDYDNDKIITQNDIHDIIDELTRPLKLFATEKEHISKILLKEIDLQDKGGMSQLEFVHTISKMPEFGSIFSFRP